MPRLTLSFISAFNERVDPLMNGAVKAEGIDIVPTYSHPSETFWRQLKFQEFDIAEMSMSSYLIARARDFDMMALPVFPPLLTLPMETVPPWAFALATPPLPALAEPVELQNPPTQLAVPQQAASEPQRLPS